MAGYDGIIQLPTDALEQLRAAARSVGIPLPGDPTPGPQAGTFNRTTGERVAPGTPSRNEYRGTRTPPTAEQLAAQRAASTPATPDARPTVVGGKLPTADQLRAAGINAPPPPAPEASPFIRLTPEEKTQLRAAGDQAPATPKPQTYNYEDLKRAGVPVADSAFESRPPQPAGGYEPPPRPPSNPDLRVLATTPDGPSVRLNNPVLEVNAPPDGLRTIPAGGDIDPPTRASPTPAAMAPSSRMGTFNGGLALFGLATSANGLYEAYQKGDTAGMIGFGVGAALSATDTARSFSQTALNSTKFAKATGLGAVVLGVFEIGAEEEGYRMQRTAAVAVTTAAGFAGGAAVTAVAASGTAVGAVAAAPVILVAGATVAVAMTADAMIEANKAADSLQQTIRDQEAVKPDFTRSVYEDTTNAPALQRFTNLRQFAALDGATPGGITPANSQEHSRIINSYEYSKDPAALDKLAVEIQNKIDAYDQTIEDNTSWYKIDAFSPDEVGKRTMAEIDRARFVAAQNELVEYRANLEVYNKKLAEQTLEPSEQKLAENSSENPQIDDEKWSSYFNPEKLVSMAGTAVDEFKAAAEKGLNTTAPQLAATNEVKATPITPGMV